ncbi:MAG: hypothetical protein FJ160_06270 [Gammaproteobacteria bacterium]|nr:hypothetical protein [Gammaproteobacteria bacterium]
MSSPKVTSPAALLRILCAGLLTLALTGCGNLLASRSPAAVTYVLRPTFVVEGAARPAVQRVPDGASPEGPAVVLQLAAVGVSPGYGGSDILVTRPDRRLDVFAASRWPDELPRVVGDLALAALKTSNRFQAFDATAPVAPTHTLRLDVRRFDAEYRVEGAVPAVHVVIDAVLTRRRDREVIASFSSVTAVEATENRLSAIVAAFEKAAGEVLLMTAKRTEAALDSTPARHQGATPAP